MARHGDAGEAESLAETIQDEKLRISTFVVLSGIARKRGQTKVAAALSARAIGFAGELKIPLDKAFVLADLGTAQAAGGEIEAARATLAEAIGVAAKIADPWARARALSKAATALVAINGI